jgi:hypothetical protein
MKISKWGSREVTVPLRRVAKCPERGATRSIFGFSMVDCFVEDFLGLTWKWRSRQKGRS